MSDGQTAWEEHIEHDCLTRLHYVGNGDLFRCSVCLHFFRKGPDGKYSRESGR